MDFNDRERKWIIIPACANLIIPLRCSCKRTRMICFRFASFLSDATVAIYKSQRNRINLFYFNSLRRSTNLYVYLKTNNNHLVYLTKLINSTVAEKIYYAIHTLYFNRAQCSEQWRFLLHLNIYLHNSYRRITVRIYYICIYRLRQNQRPKRLIEVIVVRFVCILKLPTFSLRQSVTSFVLTKCLICLSLFFFFGLNMLKVLCILLVAVLFSLSTANSEEIYNVNENILQVEGFGNEEVKESNLSEWKKLRLFRFIFHQNFRLFSRFFIYKECFKLYY